MANTQENVRINFVTAFDGKGLNNAKAQLSGFDKLAAKAGKALVGLFAVQKVEQFAKASLKAFTDDQAAALALTKTLTNLGLGFESTRVADFIQKLEKTTGVLDEQLRPAFANIVRATGDVAKSQELLNLALDISAGTGRDLSSVSLALSKGYLGQTTALGRLGTGLSKAELASGNFATIQAKLTKLFAGQAATAADSYKGKIAKLNVAFDNMKETVGKGMIDALTTLSNTGGSLDLATTGMKNFGDEIAYVLTELSKLVVKIEKLPGVGQTLKDFLSKPITLIPVLGDYIQLGLENKQRKDAEAAAQDQIKFGNYIANNQKIINKLRDAAAAKTKADNAAQLKAERDKAALAKASAALKLAEKVTNMDQIQLYAAIAQAQGQDLDRLRLQQAILDGNAAAATILADKVLKANGLVMDLQGKITVDPFAAWTTSLDKMLAAAIKAAAEIAKIKASIETGNGGGGGGSTTPPAVQDLISTLSVNPNFTGIGGQGLINALATQAMQNPATEIKVTVDPAAMAYGITLANQNQSSNGTQTTLSRNNPGYFIPQS
jgi:hypothetical protein